MHQTRASRFFFFFKYFLHPLKIFPRNRKRHFLFVFPVEQFLMSVLFLFSTDRLIPAGGGEKNEFLKLKGLHTKLLNLQKSNFENFFFG